MSSALESALCRLHQRSYCVPVASGTVGLALTTKILGLTGVGVAIPAGVCLNVPLALHYGGAAPVYCDIDPETLGLSPATLTAGTISFAAVLAVHAYGNLCAIDALAEHCRSAGIPLIEDVAVAQGVRADDRPAGSFGVASVVSFGRGKVVDVGGGGAVLTDDASLAKEVGQAHRCLPERTDADAKSLDDFGSRHTQLYNRHYGKDLDLHVAPFVATALALRTATLTRSAWDVERAAMGMENLAGNLGRRRARAAYLFERLEARRTGVRCHRPSVGAVPWRANLFVPQSRDRVLRALLGEGVKISSWYPPAQDFLAPAWGCDTPLARRVGEEILNVWVNDEVGIDYLDGVVEGIAALTSAASDPMEK